MSNEERVDNFELFSSFPLGTSLRTILTLCLIKIRQRVWFCIKFKLFRKSTQYFFSLSCKYRVIHANFAYYMTFPYLISIKNFHGNIGIPTAQVVFFFTLGPLRITGLWLYLETVLLYHFHLKRCNRKDVPIFFSDYRRPIGAQLIEGSTFSSSDFIKSI